MAVVTNNSRGKALNRLESLGGKNLMISNQTTRSKIIVLFLLFIPCGCVPKNTHVIKRLGQQGKTDDLVVAWKQAKDEATQLAIIQAFSENPLDVRGRNLAIGQTTFGKTPAIRLKAVQALERYNGWGVIEALVQLMADTSVYFHMRSPKTRARR